MNSFKPLTKQSINLLAFLPMTFALVSGCSSSSLSESILEDAQSSIETTIPATGINDVAQDLMQSLAGYQLDQFVPLVDELTANVIDGLEGESLNSIQNITIVNTQSETTITEPVTRMSYNCSGGGTITREKGYATFVNANIFDSQRLDGYVFDQCVHYSSGITLLDDTYTINGSLTIVEDQFSTSGYGSKGYKYTLSAFKLQASSAPSYELEGRVNTSTITSSNGNSSLRTSEIDLYRKTQAEKVIVSIESGAFELTRKSNAGGSIKNYDVDIDGTIAGLNTNGLTVAITTEPKLSRQRGVGFSEDSNIPFSGRVEFMSEDGSFLYLTANPTKITDTGVFEVIPDFVGLNLVDMAYTSVSGKQVVNTGVTLTPFTVIAPNCDMVRNEMTDNIECDGSEALVLP